MKGKAASLLQMPQVPEQRVKWLQQLHMLSSLRQACQYERHDMKDWIWLCKICIIWPAVQVCLSVLALRCLAQVAKTSDAPVLQRVLYDVSIDHHYQGELLVRDKCVSVKQLRAVSW